MREPLDVTALDDEQVDFINTIRSSSKLMLGLVENLLGLHL